jgi:hypothetical protein
MILKQFTVLDLIYLKNKFDDRKKLAYEWLDEITHDIRKEEIENKIEEINNDILNCLQLIDKND